MRIGDYEPGALAAALGGAGVAFRTGPFVYRLRSDLPEIAQPFATLYRDFPVSDDVLIDYHVRLAPSRERLRRIARQIVIRLDDDAILAPYPRRLAVPVLEWGLNACIYQNAHQYLVFHCAVVEKGGAAILFPGWSGTGKTTLCAALVCKGWRLLSDELAVIRPSDGMVLPIARPLSLKNESIDLIGRLAPGLVFGPRIGATAKGVISHLRPPADSVARMDEPARPAAVMFIAFEPGQAAERIAFSKARAFYYLADNSLNYQTRGRDGFDELARLIDSCGCYAMRYSRLDDAIPIVEGIV
jgi:hypothetical protein